MNKLTALIAAVAAASATPDAQAERFGHAELRSDQIERGVSQSDHRAGLSAAIGWSHRSGVHGSLGIASVSDEQYAGSAGYKLLPALGWEWAFGEHGESDYGTAELGLSLGWSWFTLSWSRSLTDYLGISALESEGSGQNLRQTVLESTGSQYLALDAAWPVGERVTLSAGIGRLKVPHFDSLDYTDWRIGLGLATGALHWGLQASGSNAASDTYRPAARSDGRSSAANTVSASVRWSF